MNGKTQRNRMMTAGLDTKTGHEQGSCLPVGPHRKFPRPEGLKDLTDARVPVTEIYGPNPLWVMKEKEQTYTQESILHCIGAFASQHICANTLTGTIIGQAN